MTDNQTEMLSLLVSISGLTCEEAEGLMTFLTEREYIKLEPNQSDTDRAVFLSRINSGMSAASYKLRNIEFNFRKAALSAGMDAIDICLAADAFLKGDNPVLYLFLLCLKVLSDMKAELGEFDAELIGFLWEARLHRRLNADGEYEAFSRHMIEHGKDPLSSIEYHHALDRLEKLRVIKLEDGMISLRERVITSAIK